MVCIHVYSVTNDELLLVEIILNYKKFKLIW